MLAVADMGLGSSVLFAICVESVVVRRAPLNTVLIANENVHFTRMSPRATKTSRRASAGRGGPSVGGDRTEVRVAFDRHIVDVLGDEHYPDADYLFTELAANAYDADATEVRFIYRFAEDAGRHGGYKLIVEDDGVGMDLGGLQRYFTFGASIKPDKFTAKGRRPIGRFGLGKVSALKAADRWFLETEREARRYFVDVDFDRWMNDSSMAGFKVERRKPRGESGTRIELVGVHIENPRDDRIVRAVRKLPLGRDFKVYLNGRLIAPRVWDGIEHHPVDVPVPIGDDGRVERVEGAIWINDEPLPIDERGRKFSDEAPKVAEVLDEDLDALAGVEVKVNGATVAREFFGREMHAHGVNWIWGYVKADWLPVLANRTGYIRDSEEGRAFFAAMADEFARVYIPWRKRVAEREALLAKGRDKKMKRTQPKKRRPTELDDKAFQKSDRALADVGAKMQSVFEQDPTRTPFLGVAPDPRPGRPSETRIRPLFEFRVVDIGPKRDEEVLPEFELKARKGPPVTYEEPVPKKGRRHATARVDATAARTATTSRRVVQPISNIALRLELTRERPTDAPFRWARDPREGQILYINGNYPLHITAASKPNSEGHRLYLAFVIGLALAEKRWPAIERQRIADYVLDLMAATT